MAIHVNTDDLTMPQPLSIYTPFVDKNSRMDTASSTGIVERRKASDFIKHLPARNLHHGIRLASSLGLTLNLFVSINFSLTDCPEDSVDIAFAKVREHYGKWIRRPRKAASEHQAPPTFVWVIENPDGCLNAHWLLHVPAARLDEFPTKLDRWLGAAAGTVYSDKAIHIEPAITPTAVGKYMLKGEYPSLAREFGIRPVYQGWVTGKRIGCSKNVGPYQVAEMRKQGKHPPARRWVPGRWK
jgi:hypothetical protein